MQDESLFAVMERIVKAEVHRLVVVDDDNKVPLQDKIFGSPIPGSMAVSSIPYQVVSLNLDKVTGVISLSDILNFLVLRPGGDDPSQPGCTDMFSKVHYMLQIFE